MPYLVYTRERPWEKAENELRDVPRRIAPERVPTIAVRRDLHGFLMLTRMGGAGRDSLGG
jgi:hypothetical protein